MRLPHWQFFTWLILIVNLLFLIWMISAFASAGGAADCGPGETTKFFTKEDCEAATAVGVGIGATFVIVLWAFIDVILGVLWLITNRGQRECPACGRRVKRGTTTCKHCGHDFRTAAQGTAQGAGSEGT